jgi:hypothetical protein
MLLIDIFCGVAYSGTVIYFPAPYASIALLDWWNLLSPRIIDMVNPLV